MTLLLALLLACGPEPIAPPPPPPPETPAPAAAPWRTATEALGTPEAIRAVVDSFHPDLLGVVPPQEVLRALERFQASWGAQALVGEGGEAGPPTTSTGPQGEVLQVRITLQQDRILSWRIELDQQTVFNLGIDGLVLADPPPPPAAERPTLTRGPEGATTLQVQGISTKGARDLLGFERALDAVLDTVNACPRSTAGAIRFRIEPAAGTTPAMVNHQGMVYDLGLNTCAREALATMDLSGGEGAIELELVFGVPPPGGP